MALILYGADLLARKPKRARTLEGLMPFLLVVGLASLLIVAEPDLGTALVIAFAVAATLLAAGMRLRDLALIGAVLAFFALLMTVIEPYRMARLTGFLNPGADASGAGFQAAQAKIALGSGGIFGVGIGNGVQKAFYLPEAHTDMISAVIGEELGLVGILGVVGLFSLFGYAGLQVAKKAKDNYGKLLVAGLTSLVLVQATINLFAVMGLAPLTGVPLPFVSYGNSSLLATLFAVGLILNVARGGTARAGKLRVVQGGRGARTRKEPIERCQESQEWWWRPGERPVTSCRPWRSPPSFGLAAPRSRSSAPASGSRPSWSRPPATRSTSSGCAGSTAATRCARAAAAAEALGAVPAAARAIRRRARRRRDGRRRLRRRPGRPGGGAAPHPAGPHRGRQPPRARQPPARRPGATRLPRLPDRRPRGRALRGHRAAGARGRACRRPRRRPRALRRRRRATAACW